MEALKLVLARLGDAIDTNRLYTTGLSSGGCMAFDMLTSYPGVFAASVPVGGFERHGMITNRVVAWKIENAVKERADDYYWSLAAVARRKGGELRYSDHPPRCGIDGLSGTWFELRDAARGDWWSAEFENPVVGRFEVATGRPGGGRSWLSEGRRIARCLLAGKAKLFRVFVVYCGHLP